MPYKSEKMKLPRELDRRVKLTEEQRQQIREEYATGATSLIALANKYEVSKRTIQFTLYPERYTKAREQFKERRKDGRYKGTKEQWAKIQKEHRQYKQELYKQGLLTESNPEEK